VREGAGGVKLTKSQLKTIKSWEKQIALHKDKLKRYKANPAKYDNKGLLKNAPNDAVRKEIIQSRISKLEKEIKQFERKSKSVLQIA